MGKMVSVIIPAYNEAGRIGRTLNILRQVHLIKEIIVVDDGSMDDTAHQAKKFAHLVLILPENRGKSYAMHVGVAHASHDIILFCDADMYGFLPRDIEELLSPVINSTADMSIGLRTKPYYFSRLLPIAAQFSGLRAMLLSRWNSMPFLLVSGFQIELALYLFAREGHWKTAHMHIPRLHHTVKEDKYGVWKGLIARAHMIAEIVGLLVTVYLPRKQKTYHRKFKKVNSLQLD